MRTAQILMLAATCLAPLALTTHAATASETCFNNLTTNPELAALQGKVALGPLSDQTFRMQTNEATPTKEEKEVIVRWVDLRKGCFALSDDLKKSLPPRGQTIMDAQQAAFERAALDLYDGKINYGGFARLRSDIASKTKAQIADVIAGDQQDQADRKAQACNSARQDVTAFCHGDASTNIQLNNGSGSISSNGSVRTWNGSEIMQCNSARQRAQNACK